jgi:hypothetical protein
MNLDVYYSYQSQDAFGAAIKTWNLNQTLIGYVQQEGSMEKNSLKAETFFEYSNRLVGRTYVDPRISMEGTGYPITSMLITNIQDSKTGTTFYTESAGKRSGKPTIYDVMSVDPHINPWNEIEYYKVYFVRSDLQEINRD